MARNAAGGGRRGNRRVPHQRGEVYALVNKCPHKQGPLSQGIVHGDSVTCPLHNWRISLRSGEALGEDEGCVPTIPVKVDAGRISCCAKLSCRESGGPASALAA